jgi:hypothetical protein
MPTRYNQSSPYPTGNAPFAVDLSQQMWNIAQQRIQNRKQEIEDEKKEISETERILLTALDFETVKGAQDKTTVEIAKTIGDMTSKWSQKMKEKGGILSTEDKLELLRDKRGIENRMQTASADVAQYQQLQKDMSDPKKRDLYDPSTLVDMATYAKEGKIGSGGAINIPKYKPQAWGQDFMAMAEETVGKQLLDPRAWDDVPIGVDDFGGTQYQKSNKKIVESQAEALKNTPEWQSLYQENPYNANLLLESFKAKYLREPVHSIPKSKTGTTTGGKTSAQLTAETEQNEKFGSFNNLALNLMDMDADTINTIKLNKEGEITNISYDQTADGGTEMVFDFQPITTATGRKERLPERIKLPKDQKNTAEMNAFYTKLWNILPADIKKGVDFSDIPKVIKPRQGKYTGRKVAYQNVQNIENAIVLAEKNPSNENIKSLVKTIKENYPNINVKANTPVIGGNSITIYNEDGNGKIYSFKDDIKIKEFRQKIDEKIKTPQQEKLKLTDPAKKVKLKDGTEITAEEFINNLDEKDKEEAIKRINNIP